MKISVEENGTMSIKPNNGMDKSGSTQITIVKTQHIAGLEEYEEIGPEERKFRCYARIKENTTNAKRRVVAIRKPIRRFISSPGRVPKKAKRGVRRVSGKPGNAHNKNDSQSVFSDNGNCSAIKKYTRKGNRNHRRLPSKAKRRVRLVSGKSGNTFNEKDSQPEDHAIGLGTCKKHSVVRSEETKKSIQISDANLITGKSEQTVSLTINDKPEPKVSADNENYRNLRCFQSKARRQVPRVSRKPGNAHNKKNSQSEDRAIKTEDGTMRIDADDVTDKSRAIVKTNYISGLWEYDKISLEERRFGYYIRRKYITSDGAVSSKAQSNAASSVTLLNSTTAWPVSIASLTSTPKSSVSLVPCFASHPGATVDDTSPFQRDLIDGPIAEMSSSGTSRPLFVFGKNPAIISQEKTSLRTGTQSRRNGNVGQGIRLKLDSSNPSLDSNIDGLSKCPAVVDVCMGGISHNNILLSTLTKDKDSALAKMFTGKIPIYKNHYGSYCIDGDGNAFIAILDYLSFGRLPLVSSSTNGNSDSLNARRYTRKELQSIHQTAIKLGLKTLVKLLEQMEPIHFDLKMNEFSSSNPNYEYCLSMVLSKLDLSAIADSQGEYSVQLNPKWPTNENKCCDHICKLENTFTDACVTCYIKVDPALVAVLCRDLRDRGFVVKGYQLLCEYVCRKDYPMSSRTACCNQIGFVLKFTWDQNYLVTRQSVQSYMLTSKPSYGSRKANQNPAPFLFQAQSPTFVERRQNARVKCDVTEDRSKPNCNQIDSTGIGFDLTDEQSPKTSDEQSQYAYFIGSDMFSKYWRV